MFLFKSLNSQLLRADWDSHAGLLDFGSCIPSILTNCFFPSGCANLVLGRMPQALVTFLKVSAG